MSGCSPSSGDHSYNALTREPDDGIALYSTAHPRPPWWQRPYWWLRMRLGMDVSEDSLETIEIEVQRELEVQDDWAP